MTVEAYRDLPLRMRQAAGLIAVTRWLRRSGLVIEGYDELADHLWGWLTVTPQDFDEWFSFRSPLRLWTDHPEFVPAGVEGVLDRAGVPVAEFQAVLESLVEITYGGLFGATNEEMGLAELAVIERFVAAGGGQLPDPRMFGNHRYRFDPWGSPTAAEVAAWRTVAT